jgi:hypothetical protein
MQRREYIIAAIVAVLLTAHAVYGFVDPSLPMWGLFRRFDRFDYSLIDSEGNSFRLGDFVQQRAYHTCDHRLVYLIGSWLAESGRARPPIWGRITVWSGDVLPTSTEFTIRLAGDKAAVELRHRS